jgi:PAS domain S-box-containing protein
LWYLLGLLGGAAATSASLTRRPRDWCRTGLGLVTAVWCLAVLVSWQTRSAAVAMGSFRLQACCALGSLLLFFLDLDGGSRLGRITAATLAALVPPLMLLTDLGVRRAFWSPVGWLGAPGVLSPAVSVVTLGLLLVVGWQSYAGKAFQPWQVPSTLLLIGALLKDTVPAWWHSPFYLAWTPVLLGGLGFIQCGLWWASSGTTRPAAPLEAAPSASRNASASGSGGLEVTTRHSAERFRVLIEYSSDCILILDTQGMVHYHSPMVRRLIAQHTRYVPGLSFYDFVHPEDRSTLQQVVVEVQSAPNRAMPVEFRMHRRRDEWSYMQGRAINLLLHREITGIVLNLKDVSDSKRLEVQLLQAQKMEAIGRLAGGVAHDFNNLLTAIQGYSDMILRTLDPETEAYDHLCQIQMASDRAAALTQQLLAFSRQKTLQVQLVSVAEVIAGTHDMLRRIIGEDVELVVVLAPGTGSVMADPTQLQQIVMNLAVNARDAMPKGGQLQIECCSLTVDESLPWARGSSYVQIVVRDTGCGMSKQIMAHIFEPFFTTKEVGKGTGLGLSTVYGIVKQGGGHIEVESVPQQGTTFRVYLPQVADAAVAQPASARRRAVKQNPPLLPTRRETLLLVEDDETIRRLAERVLRAKGYQMLVASNGVEALRVSSEHTGRIHLVLTDIVMPTMNGVELAAKLAKTRPETRVLFMSGYVPEATGAGEMEHTLQKPFTTESLVNKVHEVLLASRGQ